MAASIFYHSPILAFERPNQLPLDSWLAPAG